MLHLVVSRRPSITLDEAAGYGQEGDGISVISEWLSSLTPDWTSHILVSVHKMSTNQPQLHDRPFEGGEVPLNKGEVEDHEHAECGRAG
jgi:hypothetical protein